SLGLAAAGREEQEVDDAALTVGRVDDAGQIEEDEGELERAPARRVDLLGPLAVAVAGALAHRGGDGAVGQLEGEEGVGVAGGRGEAGGDPVASDLGALDQLVAGLLPERVGEACVRLSL